MDSPLPILAIFRPWLELTSVVDGNLVCWLRLPRDPLDLYYPLGNTNHSFQWLHAPQFSSRHRNRSIVVGYSPFVLKLQKFPAIVNVQWRIGRLNQEIGWIDTRDTKVVVACTL